MKIRFTPPAKTQLEFLTGLPANSTGFMMGQDMGKIKIIQNIFPINFTPATIDELYEKMFHKLGDHLMGVFFNNMEPFANDWFIEDLIMKILDPDPEFYKYNAKQKFIRLKSISVS